MNIHIALYLFFSIISINTACMYFKDISSDQKKFFLKYCLYVERKDKKLDKIREELDELDSIQEIIDISKRKIVVKENVNYGKRYGTCHNYAFTKLMGIVGKAPTL